MKTKKIFLVFALSFSAFFTFAEGKKSAETLKNEALKQEAIQDSILYIKSNLSDCETLADKRSILFFLGNLQEQLGLYSQASKSYAQAAGISAGDAKNMQKVSAEQLVLNAVRASLNSGDWETAKSYLNSAVRSSKNPQILAYVNLYGIWADLCRASNYSETKDSIELLKAYSSMESMIYVKPAVLLTLWYITGETSYADKLKKDYSASPEAGIVKGTVQIASVPFWYFVPRKISEENETETLTENKTETSTKTDKILQNTNAKNDEKKVQEVKSVTSKTESSKTDKTASEAKAYERQKTAGVKEQLGFFREEKNARELVDKLRAKNFDAYFYKEKRSSGTTYFIVVVDENSDLSVEKKLKAAGFDCYKTE